MEKRQSKFYVGTPHFGLALTLLVFQLEYIVDEEVTHEVLTQGQVYSFEAGTATVSSAH